MAAPDLFVCALGLLPCFFLGQVGEVARDRVSLLDPFQGILEDFGGAYLTRLQKFRCFGDRQPVQIPPCHGEFLS
jgi:hypothetical protein